MLTALDGGWVQRYVHQPYAAKKIAFHFSLVYEVQMSNTSSKIRLVLSMRGRDGESIWLCSVPLDEKYLAMSPKSFLELLEDNNNCGSWRTTMDWESSSLRTTLSIYSVSAEVEVETDI